MTDSTGVVIAGAGPNGLMLAGELGLAGIRSVVLDPMPGPDPQPRANRIVGEAARILDHRGLYSVLTGTAELPKPAPRSIFAGFPLDLSSDPDSQLFVVPIQQRGLVEVLGERAGEHGADIRWGHALTGFEQHDDGVTVHVAGPDGAYGLAASYLVGADGGTSKTRHLAGIDFAGMSSYDLVMRMGFNVEPPDEWMAPVIAGSLPPLRFHRTERGVFSCGAMGSRVVSMTYELEITAREQRSDDPADEPPMSLAELEASATRVLGVDVQLRPVSPDAPMDLRRIAGINSRIASRYQLGRVFLVGDAAHVHSPMGGPGLNLSLQDAVNLGWKLAGVLNGRVEPALLATYQTERRAAAERVIMQSRAQLALLRPGPEVTALRDLFSELVTEPVVVRHLSDLLSGADNRYTMGADMHPLAGRWVPDFAVANAVGTQRVAELARSGRPILVDLTESGGVAASVTDVKEQLTVAAGRLVGEVPATAMLVRPDGYVAWASSQARPNPDQLRGLRSALTYWFGI
ncbi:MAG: FAD-dependent monooxygenase [Mycobacterium sp.]|uniref:FAD-dependent monooxygenase n=1 Tax=Mycobacterium sp. TaxID=1785 RepID=UPI003BB698AD